MKGIYHWYIDWLPKNETSDFYYTVNLNLRISGIYGLMGDSPHALEYLENAWEARESSLPNIKYNPELALLRDDPRFKAMLKEMKLD